MHPERFELSTSALRGRRSALLSYGCIVTEGIEPSLASYQDTVQTTTLRDHYLVLRLGIEPSLRGISISSRAFKRLPQDSKASAPSTRLTEHYPFVYIVSFFGIKSRRDDSNTHLTVYRTAALIQLCYVGTSSADGWT